MTQTVFHNSRAPLLDLPRLVMRRAAWVALAVLLGATVLGLAWVGRDIDDEADAAVALAQLVAGVSVVSSLDEAQALRALRELPAATSTRHLVLKVRTPAGLMVLGNAEAQNGHAPFNSLLAFHRKFFARSEPRTVSWALQRPDGQRWMVSLAASHEGERAEALTSLLRMLLLLLACVAGLLLVMRWNVRRALKPLDSLLHAMARIESGDKGAVDALPPMPIRELDAMARALRHLAAALRSAEAERRTLAQRVLTLQEDERARLARELHDEFGQHLTALRVDAAWLARSGTHDARAQEVVAAVADHVQHLQRELRSVLNRLRPLARSEDGTAEGSPSPFTLDSLAQMLESLVAGWSGRPSVALSVKLQLGSRAADGQAQGWPADAACRPLPAHLGLAVYRITQEALSNLARHAQAEHAAVVLTLLADGALEWSVSDDGIGLADPASAMLRGSGLAGIKERIWALGADLRCTPTDSRAPRAGLRLSATLQATLPSSATSVAQGETS